MDNVPATPASAPTSSALVPVGAKEGSTPATHSSHAASSSTELSGEHEQGTNSDPESEMSVKFRSLQEISDETCEVEGVLGLCFLSIEEPASYAEAACNEN